MLPQSLAFVDVETTGGSPASHRVIEVAVVLYEQGVVTRRYVSLVDPECRIPRFIERITGITNADVTGAPVFRQLAGELRGLLSGPVIVAHNAHFDVGFLRAEFARVGLSWQPRQLCTVRLSRRLYPDEPTHTLDALIRRHALQCPDRHRALSDADVLRQFWETARHDWGQIHLAGIVTSLLAERSPTARRSAAVAL